LLAGPVHQVAAETGYDYTYENYVDTDDGVSIHSARGFLGYEGKLSSDTGLSGAAEILVNINELDSPAGQIDSLEDTRFNGKVAITTEMFGGAAFRFSFTARYDHAPAPRPPFPTIPYAAGFQPLADELDTLTEVSLIVNFL
jgi:hypothetical protein